MFIPPFYRTRNCSSVHSHVGKFSKSLEWMFYFHHFMKASLSIGKENLIPPFQTGSKQAPTAIVTILGGKLEAAVVQNELKRLVHAD